MTDIPPPRYRVIERGRRLEVIDTHSGRPVTAPPAPPAPPSARTSLPARASPPRLIDTAASRLRLQPEANGLIVRVLCRGETLSDSRAVLQTLASYDGKGPRRIALDASGIARMQRLVIVSVLAVFALVAAVTLVGFPGLVIAGIATGFATQHGKKAMARWLDRLGETLA